MGRIERTWLISSAALALGIALALACPRAAALWPVAVGMLALVGLLGFGFAVRGWGLLAVVVLGLALAWRTAVADEQLFREAPWMREAVRRVAHGEKQASLVRSAVSRRIGLGVEHAPELTLLSRAMLMGERRRLPTPLKRAFVDAGAIHVFAVSGLHVMVVAGVLMFLAAFCFVPWRWQGIVTLPILWGYVFLIGSPPSAVRAVLMATFYFGAPAVWRRPNGLVAWSLAFWLVHLWDPRQLTEVGSLFSFVVMLALILAGRIVRLPKGSCVQLAFLTFVAWAAGVPIAAAAFGRLTFGGLFSNLLLVSMVTGAVTAGALGVLFGFVWVPLAVHFNNLAALLTQAMVVVASAVARLPGATVEIPPWGVSECLGWYLALGLFFYLIRHIRQRRGLWC